MPPNADLSLLFRLRADNTQAKAVIGDTRAAVAQLRQAFGPQLTQTVTIANKVFSDLDGNLRNFVAQRVPLIGGAVVQITDKLKGFGGESAKSEKAFTSLTRSIESLATRSGKSVPQVTSFLSRFVQLEGQAKRNEAAFQFFGGSVDLIGNKTAKFIPELEQAGASLAAVSASTKSAGAALASLAGPLAIVATGVAAEIIVVAALARQIFELARVSAEYQGKLFDLSQQVGVSVETLSALEVVARTTGSSIEGLTQSLGIFQKHLDEAQDENSKAAKTFKNLGVDVTDTEGSLRAVVAALARMPEGFRQTSLALEIFGRGGKAFLAIAKESQGDIDEITNRLRGLGLVTTEEARIADQFNDQLVILNIQLRGLGTRAIPVILDALQGLSKALEENRLIFRLLQGAVAGLATGLSIPLKLAFGIAKQEIQKALPVFIAIGLALKVIKEAIEFISGHPISFPGFSSGPAPTPIAPTSAEPTKDPFLKQVEDEIAARRRLQAVLNYDFEQQKLRAQASIAQARRDFEAGKKTRKELLDATLSGIKAQSSAEIQALEKERSIKLQEQALARDDIEKQTQNSQQIQALDLQILNKRSELKQRLLDEQARFNREEEANETAHQERLLARSQELDQVQIRGIEQRIALQKQAALEGDKEIEGIELRALDREQAHLVRRLEIVGRDEARRREIQDRIKALDVQRTATEQRHSEQRLAIVEREADVVLQRIQISGEALNATISALASAREITEEEAARRIGKIRLEALDAEIELAKTRGAETRILGDQRRALEAQIEREIEQGRQADLDNARQYADELQDITERITEIQRDAAEEVIRSLRLNFASRWEIIRARTKLDLDDEEAQHRAAQRELNDRARENRESNRTALEKLNIEFEINQAREAEAERHRAAMLNIKTRGKRDEEDASPFGRLRLGTDDLKEFANTLESQIIPLGEVLKSTFLQVADAIGQTVANWVLLGETGPAVMRKILAQALASLAAEATVNAIKELALGFATLFFNPAESAAHFTAAALWGSIAGVSAIAGRGVAGDLFKSKSGSGGSADTGRPGQINPLTLERTTQQQPRDVRITVNVSQDRHSIVDVFAEDFQSGGKTREVINNDGLFGG